VPEDHHLLLALGKEADGTDQVGPENYLVGFIPDGQGHLTDLFAPRLVKGEVDPNPGGPSLGILHLLDGIPTGCSDGDLTCVQASARHWRANRLDSECPHNKSGER
jgi:hypothetical protein